MDETTLTSNDLVVIFAQAQAGLGHLRVTDALYHGLPADANAVLLGSEDTNITFIHNLTSQHVFLRRLVNFFESGMPQELFAAVYRWWLQTHTESLRLQFKTILDRHPKLPKTVLVVATHFGLAHQFAAIKNQIARHHGVRVILAVIVTDDAPLPVWAVGGADFIVVPSTTTKKKLEVYHARAGLPPATYIVLPYMVSQRLGKRLSAKDKNARMRQFDPKSEAAIHVAVPIAGAAVQLNYLKDLMESLLAASPRFQFHVVARFSKMTEPFLASLSTNQKIELISSTHHRETVDLYEKLYEREVIAFEVTKPSEQAFKALLTPRQRGGSILLFSDPVGQQEWDNLAFLERHHLIPQNASRMLNFRFDAGAEQFTSEDFEEARKWRALRLPGDAAGSADFILWALKANIFMSLGNFAGYDEDPALHSDGVEKFWELIGKYLRE